MVCIFSVNKYSVTIYHVPGSMQKGGEELGYLSSWGSLSSQVSLLSSRVPRFFPIYIFFHFIYLIQNSEGTEGYTMNCIPFTSVFQLLSSLPRGNQYY